MIDIEKYTKCTINITMQLARYINRLDYLYNRYKRFNQVISSIETIYDYMTIEEFRDCAEYFAEEEEKAKVSLNAAIESIRDIYSDKIGPNDLYHIDYIGANIYVFDNKENSHAIKEYILNKNRGIFRQYVDDITTIFDDEEDEFSTDNKTHIMDVTLQVTDACNMRCTYCYQHNKGQHKMDFNTAKKFIDMLFDNDKTRGYIDFTRNKGIILDFIGGEPLLEIDLINEISEYFCIQLFKRKSPIVKFFMFSIATNGLLYFDKKVKNYIEKYANLLSIAVSVDGNKELHDSCRIDLEGKGTYDRAYAAAKELLEKYDHRGTKMTIAPNNVKYLYDAFLNLLNMGYRNIHFNTVYEDVGWTIENARDYYYNLIRIIDYLEAHDLLDINTNVIGKLYCKPIDPDYNRNWCGGTGIMLAVDYKGDCYPCLRYMESSLGGNQDPIIIGNIEDGLLATKDQCDKISCLECITRRSQSTDECFNCPIGNGCAWCSANNYEIFGTVNKRTTFHCIMHKARSLANAYYIKKMYGSAIVYCPKEWAIPIIGEDEYNKLKEYCEFKK